MVKTAESAMDGDHKDQRLLLMCPDCGETYSRVASGGYIPPDVCGRCGTKLSPVTYPAPTISSGAVRDRSN